MTPDMPLAHLHVPHLSTLLEEAFGVLPPLQGEAADPSYPHTIEELATFAEQSVPAVITTLHRIQQDLADLFLPFSTAQALQERGEAFFFDARTYGERMALPLAWAYQFTAPRVLKLLSSLQSSPRVTVFTLASSEAKGMSAALFLRGQGIAAKTLLGGISPAQCTVLGSLSTPMSRIHQLLPPRLRFSPSSPL